MDIKIGNRELREYNTASAIALMELCHELARILGKDEVSEIVRQIRPREAAASLSPNHTPLPPRPKTPEFSVGRNRAATLVISLRMPSGECTEYAGHPDYAERAFRDAGFKVSKEIVQQYRGLYENEHTPVGNAR